jgi:hypothetical protein
MKANRSTDFTTLALPAKAMPIPPRAAAAKRTGHFIKGPISLSWITCASSLPGRALHVALCLWYLCGLTKSREVALGNQVLQLFCVDRHSKYRAVKALEQAGLVRVTRTRGALPRIVVLEHEHLDGN